jgi:septum formation protein
MPERLILASTSRYRSELLRRLGVPFAVEAPGIDERPAAGETPRDRALRLAREKAAAVSERHPGAWILGSDQVAICGGSIHGKPGDAARCRQQLRASSGRGVEFFTAAVLRRGEPVGSSEHVDRTVVRFRQLSDEDIARYVELERPLDCAGGFRSEGLGAALLESIETLDPTALVGLPLLWVAAALRAAGLDPLSKGDGHF